MLSGILSLNKILFNKHPLYQAKIFIKIRFLIIFKYKLTRIFKSTIALIPLQLRIYKRWEDRKYQT